MRTRSGFMAGIGFLIISIAMIIIGLFLTVTLVFYFIGIPLLVLGVVFLFLSILIIIFGTMDDILTILKKPFKRKPKDDVVELEKQGEIYTIKEK